MPGQAFVKINLLPLEEWKEGDIANLNEEEKNILEWRMFNEKVYHRGEEFKNMRFWKDFPVSLIRDSVTCDGEEGAKRCGNAWWSFKERMSQSNLLRGVSAGFDEAPTFTTVDETIEYINSMWNYCEWNYKEICKFFNLIQPNDERCNVPCPDELKNKCGLKLIRGIISNLFPYLKKNGCLIEEKYISFDVKGNREQLMLEDQSCFAPFHRMCHNKLAFYQMELCMAMKCVHEVYSGFFKWYEEEREKAKEQRRLTERKKNVEEAKKHLQQIQSLPEDVKKLILEELFKKTVAVRTSVLEGSVEEGSSENIIPVQAEVIDLQEKSTEEDAADEKQQVHDVEDIISLREYLTAKKMVDFSDTGIDNMPWTEFQLIVEVAQQMNWSKLPTFNDVLRTKWKEEKWEKIMSVIEENIEVSKNFPFKIYEVVYVSGKKHVVFDVKKDPLSNENVVDIFDMENVNTIVRDVFVTEVSKHAPLEIADEGEKDGEELKKRKSDEDSGGKSPPKKRRVSSRSSKGKRPVTFVPTTKGPGTVTPRTPAKDSDLLTLD